MKLVYLTFLFILAACSGGGGGGSSSTPAPQITHVIFQGLSGLTNVPNEDLEISGTCESTSNNAPFKVVINGVAKDAVCSDSEFSVVFPAADLPPGQLDIDAVTEAGGSEVEVPSVGGVPVTPIVKDPCNLNQDLNAGSCDDRAISSPEIAVDAPEYGGENYSNSPTVEFSLGTTSDARTAYVFSSTSDCTDFSSNNCHLDNTVPACVGIDVEVVSVIGESSFTYEIPGATSGVESTVAALFSNGSQLSTCVSDTVTLDSDAPTGTLALDVDLTNDPAAGPRIEFNAGSPISDSASGVAKVEVAVGTSATADDISSFTDVPLSSTDFTPSFGTPLDNPGPFYTLVRVTDNLGNVTTIVSDPWDYVACTSVQTLTAGSCVDNAISSAQILITNGEDVAGSMFIGSSDLVLSIGTTLNAQSVVVTDSLTICQDHLSNTCFDNPTLPACVSLTATVLSPGTNMAYTHGSLVSGALGEVATYYVNGTQKSSCVSASVTLDTDAPSFSIALEDTWGRSTTVSPKVIFNSGAVITDSGVGIDTISVALSTDGVNADLLAFSDISTSLTESAPALSGSSFITGVSYYTLVKATDLFGNETTVSSVAWEYTNCSEFQNPQTGGICEDKDILTPQLIVASGSTYNSIQYIDSSSLSLSEGTTVNAQELFVFPTTTACNDFRDNDCHANPAAPACSSLSSSQFTPAGVPMSYTHPSISDNTALEVVGYYSNGSKTTSCLSVDIKKNAPVIDTLALSKPLEIVEMITDEVVTPTDLALPVSDNIATVGAASVMSNVVNTTTWLNNGTAPVSSVLTKDNIVDGWTSDISGSLSAGDVLVCTSTTIFSTSCSITATTFSGSIDSLDTDESGVSVTISPGFDVDIPSAKYTIKQMTHQFDSKNDYPKNFYEFNGWLYFSMTGQIVSFERDKLFRTNGTVIEQVTDTYPASGDDVAHMVEFENELYFQSTTSAGQAKIYKTDGETFVHRISNISTSGGDTLDDPIVFNDNLYFFATNSSWGKKLFKFDGTTFTQVSNTRNSQSSMDWVSGSHPAIFGGNLYLFMLDANGNDKLYRTNGTTLEKVLDIYAQLSQTRTDSLRSNLVEVNGRAYLSGNRLLQWSGSQADRLSTINTSYFDGERPYYLLGHNDELYFAARTTAGPHKLFKMGADKAIKQITDLRSGLDDLEAFTEWAQNPGVVCNTELFWPLYDSEGHMNLFKIESDRIVQMMNHAGSVNENVTNLHCFNDELYFSANDLDGYSRLWKLSKEDL